MLDDNRLYRRTDAPLPPTPKKAKPKAKPKARKSRGTRASKRQKLNDTQESEEEQEPDTQFNGNGENGAAQTPVDDDDFGGMKWECVAITLEQYQEFVESIRRSTDADEKALRTRIIDEIMPTMEAQAEKQRQKAMKKQRELDNMQKLASAKRSSRLAGKRELEKQKEEEEALEKKRVADLAMARKEQEKQRQMEEVRHDRLSHPT